MNEDGDDEPKEDVWKGVANILDMLKGNSTKGSETEKNMKLENN